MKVRVHTMLGTQHSWSGVMHDYIRAMKEIGGHEIFLKSTNGLEHFPEDLKDLLVPGYHGNLVQGPADFLTPNREFVKIDPKKPVEDIKDSNVPYDLELAYTIFYQGPRRFFPQSKCRAVIWNFESSILPPGWHLYHKAIDYILPSSQYSYDIFADNGVPKDKMLVVPHGVDTRIFNPEIPPFQLKTQKRVKFLHCARPHHRKLHERVIRGYLDAFTGDDDVCLVLKTSFIKPAKDKVFEVDVRAILEREFKGRKNPPEVEIVDTYIPHIGSLYTACDVSISMSSCEGFYLPGLEAMACGLPVIAPRHGGQLEYMNDKNALLVNTGIMKAPASMQYWVANPEAVVGDPDIEHYKELMRKVYEAPETTANLKAGMDETVKKFNWQAASQMILDLPIPKSSKRIGPKKRVLYIMPYNMVGGGEIWVLEALRRLDQTKFEPHVAFVSGMSNKIFIKQLQELGANIEDLGHQGRGQALKCLVEAGGYEIIHFYNSFSVYNVLREAYKQGLRAFMVETVHSDLKWQDSMSKVGARDKMVSAIVSVSNTQARQLLKAGNRNVHSVPQQVNWNRFTIPRSKDVLKKYNIPEKFTVGFVGRLSPEKNVPAVIQCAKLLPDINFVIVGDGPQGDLLKNLASPLKNVFFVGPQADTSPFYAAFDTLMLPSNVTEGIPLVILEAMACGTPVVASDIGAVSEIVNDSINGYLIWNPGDPRLFAQAIQNIVKNEGIQKQFIHNSKTVVQSLQAKYKNININTVYSSLYVGR